MKQVSFLLGGLSENSDRWPWLVDGFHMSYRFWGDMLASELEPPWFGIQLMLGSTFGSSSSAALGFSGAQKGHMKRDPRRGMLSILIF